MLWILLALCAVVTVCSGGDEQQTTGKVLPIATGDVTTNIAVPMVTDDVTAETTVFVDHNITCQEGPDVGFPPSANQLCDCGTRGYFYGNYCQYVNLTSADDVNTSKRVMEVQWKVSPNFTREYSFLYREYSSSGAPLRQPVNVQQGAGFYFTWLTYLKSGEVSYVVCVIQKTMATEIVENEDMWSRIDDVINDDCVKIVTEVGVTTAMTFLAIVIGGVMGLVLIVIFIAHLVVNRRDKLATLKRENRGSKRVEQTMVLTQNMNTQHDYIDMYDQVDIN